jgi:predicted transposase/invertase (TIGR01784 family)
LTTKRETAHIFDLVLKQLIKLSNVAIINFINVLFGTDHPLDSTVEYPNTENVSKKLRRLMSDTIVIIGGVHVYHVEAEIGDDENIVIRIFEYGFMEGLRTKTMSENGSKISIKFPNAKVIYWETTKKTPDEVTLSLEFPEGGLHEYKVKAFKFLEHSVKELEERKLAILLPFYVLKLRRQTVRAGTSKRRAKLAEEMKAIVDELVAASDRAEQTGLMSEIDKHIVLDHMERLYRELFAQYEEFKESDVVLQDRILTYSEEAELKGRAEGRAEGKAEGRVEGMFEVARNLLAMGLSFEQVAQGTGLPQNKLQDLLSR